MKTVEEKSIEWLDLNIKGKISQKLEYSLIKLIKEQDRDTRHACAEAVDKVLYKNRNDHEKTLSFVVDVSSVCINVKAV